MINNIKYNKDQQKNVKLYWGSSRARRPKCVDGEH